MRVVFMGTPAFAVPSLQALLDAGHDVVGVFTQPDRPAGRGKKLQASPVKQLAGAHGIPVFQPQRIRRDGVKVVKPAAGYASFPDHSIKRDILALLPSADTLGITLTETCAMTPAASICGLVLVHPEACYPDIRHISQEQYDRYAAARGFSPDEARLFLSHLL